MENIENYLYLLFVVIYIISRVLKGRSKQKQADDQQQPRPKRPFSDIPTQRARPEPQRAQSQPKKKKAFTFEEILKEFEKNLSGEDDPIHEKPLPVEEIRHEKPRPVKAPPPPKKTNPYHAYNDPNASISSTPSDKMSKWEKEEFERNQKYKIKEKVVNDYARILRDPQGIKDAIILNEILNRKYF